MKLLSAGLLSVAVASLLLAEDKNTFDHAKAREEIFAGFNGDKDQLAAGLKRCDDALAKNPKDAEAMVWRGAVRVFKAGQAFQNKKNEEGLTLWTTGLKDLDEAVKLDPKSGAVRIPRAAVLVNAGRNAPESMRKDLLAKALGDFQTIMDSHKTDFDKLSTHRRGELRMGLADVLRLQGELDKSKEQLKLVVKELPDSKYAKRAEEWLNAKDSDKLSHSCIGCHKPKE